MLAAFTMANTVKKCRTTRYPLLLLASLPLPVTNLFTSTAYLRFRLHGFSIALVAIFLRHGDVSGYINVYTPSFSPITFTHIYTQTHTYLHRRPLISRSSYSIQSPHQVPIPGKGGRSSSRRRSALLSRFIVLSSRVFRM